MTPHLEFKSYSKDKDFRDEGKPEPNSRSQTLIYHLQDKKLCIKVTLQGTFSSFTQNAQPDQPKSKRERREELQKLVRMMHFQSMALLGDTVTALVLNQGANPIEAILNLEFEDSNQLTKLIIKDLRFYIREDPSRVMYPPSIEFPPFRAIRRRRIDTRE